MQLDDETLQRYYDGELSPVEERAVRAQVEAAPDARKRLAQLARLSELFRTAASDMGREVDSESLFADIQADIARQGELGFGERLRVVAGEWLEHKRTLVIPLVATTAVAAVALLTVLLPDGHEAIPVALGPVPAEHTEPPASPFPAQEAKPAVHGSRVEVVDFGSNTGTVFEIESQGVTTAVVWISDDEDAP